MNMHKKIVLLAMLLCPLTEYAFNLGPRIEIKPGYFLFYSSPMKNIYKHGGFEIQGSISIPLFEYLDFYSSIGYREAKGHALNSFEQTKLAVIPVDIALKPMLKVCEWLRYSFAIGPRYFYFNQHNKSPYVNCNINGSGLGLFVNTSFSAVLAHCAMFGIFGEYSYEKKVVCSSIPRVFSNGNVQIGGFVFGVSVGYIF